MSNLNACRDSYAGTSANMPTSVDSDLDVMIVSLQDHVGRFMARRDALREVADKLGGAIPRPNQGSVHDDPNGQIEHLNFLQAALHTIGEDMDSEIARLKKLI